MTSSFVINTHFVNTTSEILVIDSRVPDYQALAEGAAPGIEVIVIDGGNGLQKIADALDGRSGIQGIHIISHGSEGTVYLGDAVLSSGSLDRYADELGLIGNALSENGDLLFYGCNIAAGSGKDLLQGLATITRADIAASDDLTGKDGDWILETATGEIDTFPAITSAVLEEYAYNLATFDFGAVTDNGASVSQTVSTVTLEVSANTGSVDQWTAGAYFGESGNSIYTSGPVTTTTFTFDKAVDITSIYVIDSDGDTQTWVFTPTGGSNSVVNDAAIPDLNSTSTGKTVNLGWTGVTSFTITEASGTYTPSFDTLIFTPQSTDPTITSATYDASAGILVVTGTNFTANAGASNDIDASRFTFTGEGGETYTLTDTADVERDSDTQFTLNLSATDRAAVNQIINKDGTSSTGGTTYDLDGAAGFVAASAAVSDTGANAITVSSVPAPAITSATYDYTTNVLTVTGTGFVKNSGVTNDVDISRLTFTGEGASTYTLTSASDVEITGDTTFSVTLSGADITGVESILNRDGTAADDSTTYNLAGAAGFMAGDSTTAADLTGNGITVSNYAVPAITSTAYDWSTGQLVLTGTNFVQASGAANDIDVSTFTFTGEGGNTYTLTDSSDVEITSATTATVTLSAADRLNVHGLLNKDGTTSDDITTYNLGAGEDWMAGSPSGNTVADATASITVSSVAVPAITSAVYDSDTGVLTVTGTNFVKYPGAANDVDISALTLTGESGSYTITSASDVEITSATQFTVTLSGADKTQVDARLDKTGTSSSSGTTYNIAAADNWMPGAATSSDISDATGNGITVSVAPKITSAVYNANTGVLTVTGTNIQANGGGSDIDASTLTFTGEGGDTYTLTDTADVNRTSDTEFSLTLSAMDKAAINQIINKDGTSSTGGTTYNLAAADDWNTNVTAGDTADSTGNGITAGSVAVPAITSAAYNASTGVLTVTGTGFLKSSGAANDIDVSMFTLTGEGGDTYALTDTSDVEITSDTAFTVTLSSTDKNGVNLLLNKNGVTSVSNTTYNLAAAEDWAKGADAAVNVADTTGNGITVSGVSNPTINSAVYNAATGVFTVTGTNFISSAGANNDIDASKLTFTGEGGSNYTLTDTSDVEITSTTSFSLTLSATDRSAVNQILNKDGTSSAGGTTYDLDGAAGFVAASAAVSDTGANAITVSSVPAPAITSATYDYTSNVLTVTGTGFVKNSGANNDVDISMLTFTGEGASTYTLTSASDVEITGDTTFSVTLSGADITGVESILNRDGTAADDSTTYNLAGAAGFMAGDSTTAADLTGNGITVSNYAVPAITSTAYDWSTGQLVLTGTNFVQASGAANDIDVSTFTFTGEGGNTYTLTDSSDVEITSATTATVTLSAADRLNVHGLLNKDGTTSDDITTYNLGAGEDWMAGSPSGNTVADATASITVSSVAVPAITSAVYDSDTGVLTVTGINFVKYPGAANDVDISALSLTGEGGSYTITSASDVEITSATQFTVTLSGADKTQVDARLDQLGTSSSGGTTYNIAAADNWMPGAAAGTDISDAMGNGITVSVAPKITSAVYNANTGALTVNGTNIQANGGGSDIDASAFTFTGEGGDTYTLTDTSDVNRTSATEFTLTLSPTDKAAVNQIINKGGTASTGGTTYNLATTDDWNTNVTAGDTADTTGNGITASNVAVPAITSAAYDASTGALTVTGTGFLKLSGATNDIDVSMLTFTGEGGSTYTLTDSSDVEITSGTAFTVTLNSTDKNGVNLLMNKNGTTAVSSDTYNLAAAEDWAKGADTAVNVADLTGNGITVSNVAAPEITSATYTKQTGILKVTGTNLLSLVGADNDIDASTFTITGKAGGTYTLTDTADVDVTSTTEFSLVLSATDKTEVENLLDKSGTASADATPYNLAGAEDWNAGADASVNIVDATNNAITADLTVPSGGGGSTPVIPDDGDGATDEVEDNAPPIDEQGVSGDGNGDGVPDREQAEVASISFKKTDQISSNPDAPETYLTLVADSIDGKPGTGDGNTATLKNVQQLDAPADAPEDISMPLGLISFSAELQSTGTQESFSIYLNNDIEINGYWKQNNSGQWVNLASEEYGGAVVSEGNKIRLDFQVTDGGEFDDDGVANGVILDPGAPGYMQQTDGDPTDIVRFYNPVINKHMYSATAAEIEVLSRPDSGWIREGVGFSTGSDSTADVYRFYNFASGNHFFTTNAAEAEGLRTSNTSGYIYEGVGFQVGADGSSDKAIGRYYNPVSGGHFYTASAEEAVIIVGQLDFIYEGILGYGI